MDTSSQNKVRDLYQQSADWYSRMMDEEIELPLYEKALGGLAKRIASLDGPVLDTSCGSGHMLEQLKDKYTPGRPLLGIDLSPRMVALSQHRLGDAASVIEGEMRELHNVRRASCAAVISFFALHHVGMDEVRACFAEWHRVLQPTGQLLVATWEGQGTIDYGDQADVVALKHRSQDIADACRTAGFRVDRCTVEEVEGINMDAVYLDATKVVG